MTHSCFKSYLSNRSPYTEINQETHGNNLISCHRSSPKGINQGVPQGSVLGPLLFLLYVNDLPLQIKGANLIMFADDINVLVTDSDVNNLHKKLHQATSGLEAWFHRNNLIANIEKTGMMSFHSRQVKSPEKPQVSINGTNITYISYTKFIGIYLTETLNWNTHIEVLATMLSKVVFMLKSTKDILTPKMILNIYFSKFHSLMRLGLLF